MFWFTIGLVVGTFTALLIAGLMAGSARSDYEYEIAMLRRQNQQLQNGGSRL